MCGVRDDAVSSIKESAAILITRDEENQVPPVLQTIIKEHILDRNFADMLLANHHLFTSLVRFRNVEEHCRNARDYEGRTAQQADFVEGLYAISRRLPFSGSQTDIQTINYCVMIQELAIKYLAVTSAPGGQWFIALVTLKGDAIQWFLQTYPREQVSLSFSLDKFCDDLIHEFESEYLLPNPRQDQLK